MAPEDAMIAAHYIGAPLVIPIHYNTWPVIRQDPLPFKNVIERTSDITLAVLAPGETILLLTKEETRCSGSPYPVTEFGVLTMKKITRF